MLLPKKTLGAVVLVQQLGVLAFLEDLNSITNTYVGRLITAWNY